MTATPMDQLAQHEQSGTHPLATRVRGWGYELHEQLGAGAMGVIYRARNPTLERDVAIKFVREDLAHSAPFVRAFLREARIGATIDHPNVTRILDFGRADDGRCFIVMELLTGRPLSEILDLRRTPPVVWSVQVVAQLLGGLAAAHDQGVIHADVKPENIFISASKTDTGQAANKVKLCDFGIARVGQEVDDIAMSGKICGTPGYMSPEQWLGLQLDARSDVYSAGVVLYELLAGRLPYDVANESPLSSQAARTPEQPSRVRAQVCASLDAVVLRALSTAPERRYPSARAMRTALLECLNDLVPRSPATDDAPLPIHPLAVPATGAKLEAPEAESAPFVRTADTDAASYTVLRPKRDALRAGRLLGLAAVAAGGGLAFLATLGVAEVDPWWWAERIWSVANDARWWPR